jgi:GT2 family glycosyltransferase
VTGGPPVLAAVVVCAYTERRWDDLLAAVASARTQEPAPAEVVVVVDHHPELAARTRVAFAEAPDVVVLANDRRRGLSGARNTALAHLGARPDVVVFLDDDAAARPGWLAALLAPNADPAVAAVGGVAVPRWPDAPDGGGAPPALPRELWWVVGCTFTGQYPETGDQAVDIRNLMGCTMSFRAKVFAEIGDFAEDMGRVGTVPLGCEETELCIRLGARLPGVRVVLAPSAVVDHRVTPDRMTWRYLRRRAYAEGLSKAVVARRVGAGAGLASERAYSRVVLPAGLRRELVAAGRAVRRGQRGEAADRLRAAAAVPLALGGAGVGFLHGRVAPVRSGGHDEEDSGS